MANSSNPYGICTWRPEAECEGCSLAGHLKCRFDRRHLLHFVGMFGGFAIPVVIGVIQGGYGWYLVGWAAFCLVFFELWEIRILCSHCPYYAERGTTLHCIANYGSLKLWKYRPEPMSASEKVQLWIGFAILGGYPFPFMLLGGQVLWAIVALWGLGMFFWTLRAYTCSQCVNFSCPLNGVPREIVDAYLERNPVMRGAWREGGWRPVARHPHERVGFVVSGTRRCLYVCRGLGFSAVTMMVCLFVAVSREPQRWTDLAPQPAAVHGYDVSADVVRCA